MGEYKIINMAMSIFLLLRIVFPLAYRMGSANGSTSNNLKIGERPAIFFFPCVPFLLGHHALAVSLDWRPHLLSSSLLPTDSLSQLEKHFLSLGPSATHCFSSNPTSPCWFPYSAHTQGPFTKLFFWDLFPARNITDTYHNQCIISSTACVWNFNIFLHI